MRAWLRFNWPKVLFAGTFASIISCIMAAKVLTTSYWTAQGSGKTYYLPPEARLLVVLLVVLVGLVFPAVAIYYIRWRSAKGEK